MSRRLTRLVLLGLAAAAGSGALADGPAPVAVPAGQPFLHDVRPGPGVRASLWLSRYLPGLAGTPGDTPIYVLSGDRPGGTALVVGGTHGNEIAGIMAAVALVERARVEAGRLIVVPHANNSAVSYADPVHPGPPVIAITTASGLRRFACGARRTHPDHQGSPDPTSFQHPRAGRPLRGDEARNLDRAYPGRPDGTLTERIADAVMTLLAQERVDLAIDLHESGPLSRLAWMVVAHPRSLELGALAVVDLDAQGVPMKLEHSSETFRGLSHREWGDATDAATFLVETPNPAQADGAATGDAVDHPTLPLVRRVGIQLATVVALLEAYNAAAPSASAVVVWGVPTLNELKERDLGPFLR